MGEKKDYSVYIVTSYTNTIPGMLIKARAALKFWNRYPGDYYSHVSLCKNDKLSTMMSFARKEINNPFNSGLVMEDIRKGLFKINCDKSKIAVMKLEVSKKQFITIDNFMEYCWLNREKYDFNYMGLIKMLICAKGMDIENKFFCSQWVATVLKEAGINLFGKEEPYNIRPFDFYGVLFDKIIYEGTVLDYLNKYLGEDNNELFQENEKIDPPKKLNYARSLKKI